MPQSHYIHLVADYGSGDPAFAEVIQKLRAFDSGLVILPTSVPPFSTLATGFWTYQFATVNPIPGMVIYTNTAPRKDMRLARVKNEGEKLMYAKLKNGVRVVGVNSGYSFSFIRLHISAFHLVNIQNKGSQFRSRDFFPEAVVGIMNGKRKYIGDKTETSVIPSVPVNRIVWVDGYGNMKTTTRMSSVAFAPGQPVHITLNGIKRTAYFTDGTFSVNEGQLAYAPGSSGGEDKFLEIFLRGLSAWQDFGRPSVESEYKVVPVR